MKELPESGLNWKGVRFLDPLGRVFEYEGEFYRAIYTHKVEYVHSLFEKGIIDRLVQKRILIETKITELKLEGYGLILWHRRIPFLTRPEEWTRKFLRDAALCGIELNLELLPFGLGTIDFHCGNIQQQGRCFPVWIDLGSICPLDSINQGKGALIELQKYYLHPLYLLSQKKNLNRVCRLLLADGGIEEGEFNDLTNSFISTAGQDRRHLLEKLHKWISTLSFPSLSTEWGDYQSKSPNFNFDPNKADSRSQIIYGIIKDLQPKTVVDLSCNAGRFSLMAGELEAAVFAVDLDEGAIESLYDLIQNIDENISITAALRNLAVEQKHIIQGELVLALALSHHIGISQKYPFSRIAKVFASYSTGTLLTEFMPNGLGGTHPVPDPLPPEYSLENFKKAFEPYFQRIETIFYPIPKSWSYRVFILCTGRRQTNECEEAFSEQHTSIFNPHKKEAQISIVCQHCGQIFIFSNNMHPICPNCKKDFDFKEFIPGIHKTDKNSTHTSTSKAVFNSNATTISTGENSNKLNEILNHKIEMSDLLGGSKQPSERLLDMNPDSRAKVVHLCAHDFGGAGKAAYRLHKGLQEIGIDSTMLVMNKKSNDPSVRVLPTRFSQNRIECDNPSEFNSPLYGQQKLRWEKLLSKYSHKSQYLELFTDELSDIKLDCVKEIHRADIINFHWVAGSVDFPSLPQTLKNKTIVWTLHDMNPFTGGCHYSDNCKKYETGCSACPQLGSNRNEDLAHHVWQQKSMAYSKLDLNIVTPSKWLAKCASRSKLFSNFPIRTIPYGLPLDRFKPYPKEEIRQSLNIPQTAKVILFGAASVNNLRKGFNYLLEALSKLTPLECSDIIILTFGAFPDNIQPLPKLPIYSLGAIDDEVQIALAYSAADVFVLPSLQDNLPNTVIEAMACGVPVVGFDVGGIPDMVEHKKTGFLAKSKDAGSLMEGIKWVLSSSARHSLLSEKCRVKAESQYALEIQAQAYNKLYESVLENPQTKVPDIEELNKKGEEFFHKGKLDDAKRVFMEALTLDTKNATIHNNLAVVYHQQKDKEKADIHYQKATQLAPGNMGFQKNLADFYYAELGRIDDAVKIYTAILKNNSKDVETLLTCGHISLALENFEDASLFYRRVLEIEPGNKIARQQIEKLGDNAFRPALSAQI